MNKTTKARALAEAATHGRWEYLGTTSGGPCRDLSCRDLHPFVLGPNGENAICYMEGDWIDEQANAEHIAYWSPERALKALAVIEAAALSIGEIDHDQLKMADPDHFCDNHECDAGGEERARRADALADALAEWEKGQ